MAFADIGIDLGTATVLIYSSEKGIMLREPSVVAVNIKSGEVLSVGREAFDMLGRTPAFISAVRPLSEGVISDYKMTEIMIQYFLKKACESNLIKPRVIICVPSGVTDVEMRAVVDAAATAGARKVYLIEEPIAAAIGAGIDISQPNGNLIIDIGGGTCDVAVISLNGIVVKTSVRTAGQKFDEAIVRYVRGQYGVLIGDKMAEQLKINLGTLREEFEPAEYEIKGRDLQAGLPRKLTLTRAELRDVLLEPAEQILYAVRSVLEHTPPELAGDIYRNGALMTGGGSLLDGLDEYIAKNTKIRVQVAENPVECVAIGTGKAFEFLDALRDGFINPSLHTH